MAEKSVKAAKIASRDGKVTGRNWAIAPLQAGSVIRHVVPGGKHMARLVKTDMGLACGTCGGAL